MGLPAELKVKIFNSIDTIHYREHWEDLINEGNPVLLGLSCRFFYTLLKHKYPQPISLDQTWISVRFKECKCAKQRLLDWKCDKCDGLIPLIPPVERWVRRTLGHHLSDIAYMGPNYRLDDTDGKHFVNISTFGVSGAGDCRCFGCEKVLPMYTKTPVSDLE